MTYADRMHDKLTQAFSPTFLEIRDDSEQHRGHGGYRDGGETHFHIKIRSASFEGLSRVAAQRAVMATLKDELASRVHALALDVAAA
jgi:BolA protein